MKRLKHTATFVLLLGAVGVAQVQPAAPQPKTLGSEDYKRLQQLDQATNIWQVVTEAINALTPDKDAPCDKRIREQVATRRELAMNAREAFIWKLRSDMGIPKDYVLADDGKAFVPKEVK
jgi:hypothetical protein